MSKFLKTANSFFRHLLSDRPRVFWWSMVFQHGFSKENFGDILTPYIVEKLTGKKPVLFFPDSRFAKYFKHSLMTGSIIGRSRKPSLVWGSGIIKKDEHIKGGTFLAVRGPLTANRLKELGFDAPATFGDPAILLPLLYDPQPKKLFKTGIVAHYIDADAVHKLIDGNPNIDKTSIHFIDLMTNSVEAVIKEICKCERIISTSLHGVIVAQAYRVPALWWKFSNKLSGDDVKFYDYFASVGLAADGHSGKTLDQILAANFELPETEQMQNLQRGLLATFPYKIKADAYRI